ncbi:hypothetical protein ECDEC7B_5067, partial [Escherichia coli DEC7B]
PIGAGNEVTVVFLGRFPAENREEMALEQRKQSKRLQQSMLRILLMAIMRLLLPQ